MRSMWDFINECLEIHLTSFIEEWNGDKFEYGEILYKVEKQASKYDFRTFEGLKCVVACRHNLETLKSLCLCWKVKMVAIPISLHYGLEQCQNVVKVVQPDCIITDDVSVSLGKNIPTYTFNSFGSHRINNEKDCELNNIELMMCTSGTTGMPKASKLTGDAIINNVHAISEYFTIDSSDRILVCRPLYHCAVMVGEVLISLYRGTNITFYSEGYNPLTVGRILNRENITVMCGTPTIFKGVSNCMKHNRKSGKLRIIALSGEYLLQKYVKDIREIFCCAKIFNVYGLTEAGPRVTYLPWEKFEEMPQSVGIPLKNVSIKIVDDEGSKMEKGKIGKIWIDTPCVMNGYYRNQEKTNEHLHGKWLDTGDVGYLNDEGYLFVIGRSDDMIIRAGVNLYPKEVERKILEANGIKEAMVYGGLVDGVEQIFADVIMEKGCENMKLINIKTLISEKLPNYMMPTCVNKVQDFPRNASGKIIRPLRKMRNTDYNM